MAGFAAPPGSSPGVEMAGFETSPRCRATVSRLMPSVRAIRRLDHPCAYNVIIESLTAIVIWFAIFGYSFLAVSYSATPLIEWLVLIRPYVAGFNRPLTELFRLYPQLHQ